MTYYEEDFENAILRDYLALDRTRLANERTLLSYFSSFIGVFAAGVGLIKFVDSEVFVAIGWVFTAMAPLLLALGIVRFFQLKKRLAMIRFKAPPEVTDEVRPLDGNR